MNLRTGFRVIWTLWLCGVTPVMAQNLVPNSSFEKYYHIPFSFIDSPEKFKIPGWYSATKGTPDHFHSSSSGDASVPKNWAGISAAHTGNGYVGIFVGGGFGSKGKVYREYIQCMLSDSLRRDSLYQVEFYFKLSSYSQYKVNRIGLLLLDSNFYARTNQVVRLNPTLSIVRTSLETGNWEKANMVYKAHGGESYLVIGNFFDDQSTENERLDMRTGQSHTLSGTAYFYIDDVMVQPAEKDQDSVTSLLQSKVIKANKAYVLSHIQFEFDSYVLLPGSFEELDKLISIMVRENGWKLEIGGHADDQGSDEYNLKLSVNRAKEVADYLIVKGIAPQRIVVKGFGNKIPVVDGKDEASRAANRRVEVQFSE